MRTKLRDMGSGRPPDDESEPSDDRPKAFFLGDGSLVLYDPENVDAWLISTEPVVPPDLEAGEE